MTRRYDRWKKQRCDLAYIQRPDGKSKQLWWSARKRAQRKKLPWALPREWIQARLERGVCEATGITFDMSAGNRRAKPFAPSLDRKDNTKGYTEDNTQVVVVIHNFARGQWGDKVLHDYIRKYLNHLAKRVRT